MTTDQERMYEVLKEFDTAMLVTHALRPGSAAAAGGTNSPGRSTPGGADTTRGLDARPMWIAKVEKNCDLWFFTGAESGKVDELREDPRVQIVAQDDGRFVSLAGTARVLDDRRKAEELWKEPYKVWFPDGVNDPSLRLIHVLAEAGEFWNNSGTNRIKYLLKSAKAYVTGTRPTNDEDEYGSTRL